VIEREGEERRGKNRCLKMACQKLKKGGAREDELKAVKIHSGKG